MDQYTSNSITRVMKIKLILYFAGWMIKGNLLNI